MANYYATELEQSQRNNSNKLKSALKIKKYFKI